VEFTDAINDHLAIKQFPEKVEVNEYKEMSAAQISNVDDGELERKKEKARALAEEIETEERLAKLKRERRALQEEIDDAERKKQKRSEK